MKPRREFHEDFGRHVEPEPGSTRGFAITMAVALVLIGLFFWWRSDIPPWWSLVLAAAFLLLEWLWAQALKPLNRLWFKLGLLLGAIVAPVVMGVVFFGVVTPIALTRKALGKRSLDSGFDPAAASYWRRREPPGPDPKHLPRQF